MSGKQFVQPLSRLLSPLTGNLNKHVKPTSVDLLESHGFIRQIGSGIYDILPLGLRIQRKISDIVRNRLNEAGCTELELSTLVNPKLWQQSGRLDPETRNDEFTFSEHRKFLLAPTGEEQITTLVGSVSYRQLPLSLYQISRKFRNELRPRGGLLRTREFLMKDLYTFDIDKDSANKSYERITKAYEAIFNDIGIPYVVAEADSGDMGGNLSHEYHYLSNSGDDTVVKCGSCGYTANLEKAESHGPSDPSQAQKTVTVSEGLTATIPENRVLSPALVRKAHETSSSPVDSRIDREKGVPLVEPHPGESCTNCGSNLSFEKCIEVGHTFYLGDRYSKPLRSMVSTSSGNLEPIEMGCFGIGITRIIGAIAEKLMDEHGLVWPVSIAPYQCIVVSKDHETAKTIAEYIASAGIEVTFDDRTTRIGHSMRAARESGIPLTVVLGNSWEKERLIEVLPRKGNPVKVSRENLLSEIRNTLAQN